MPTSAPRQDDPAGRPKILVVSGFHDFRTPRKADLHFIASELSEDYRVVFWSIKYSRLRQLTGDIRSGIAPNEVAESGGVRCLLSRTIVHPFKLPGALRPVETLWFRSHALALARQAEAEIAGSAIVLLESGFPVMLAEPIRQIAPAARLIYVGSDALDVIGQAETIKQTLKTPGLFDAAKLASPRLASDLPADLPAHFVPHGIDKAAYATTAPSPFRPGTVNAVSVGSMLFDESFFRIATTVAPGVHFHVIGSGVAGQNGPGLTWYPEMPFAETVAFIQHCDVAIAPYAAGAPPYLAESSMKLAQYDHMRKPAVCPASVVGGSESRFGYVPGDADSVRGAIEAAANARDLRFGDHLSWREVADRILAIGGLGPLGQAQTSSRVMQNPHS